MIPAAIKASARGAAGQDRGKREVILRAATDVFLEAGYAAASMDRIAQVAGVSKVTIYNHYASKEALFNEIVLGLCDRLLAPLHDGASATESVEATLRRIATQLLVDIRDERVLALYRLVIAETPKFPALGQAFLEAGPERAIAGLATWLQTKTQEGALRVDHPTSAAELFFGMVAGALETRRLLAPGTTIPDADYTAHLDAAVSLFLQAHAI
jgi:TetR/AcrR family transcriptional repressor of mexJK operon